MALVSLVLAAGGCASPPRLHVDTAGEPLACTSFGWLEQGQWASITEQRLRAEVMQVLAAKGYATDEEAPDCRVSGVIFSGARPGSPVRVGLGAGRWGGNTGGSVGVSMPVGGGSRTVGNLAIDVIDVARAAEVWRGTLENAFPTAEPRAEQISGAVAQVLAEFPRR
ncbi:MAG: DUF4136 domain-containing protein [Gammaproteobacteria bacterium]